MLRLRALNSYIPHHVFLENSWLCSQSSLLSLCLLLWTYRACLFGLSCEEVWGGIGMCEVFERRFSLINSSHRYSTQPNYRSTPNYPTKTKARVPLSLFVALRLFSRADTRSGVHITCFSQKNKMYWISTIWRKMYWISLFLHIY